MKSIIIILVALALFQCDSKLSDAQKIVDKAIESSGGEQYLKSIIDFDFRQRHYRVERNGGIFSYERIFSENDTVLHDYVTNEGFERTKNGNSISVADSMKTKFTASVNSVIYFALLPYALNDPSVIKEFVGETTINNKSYYKIKVTFKQEGGGEDFQDTFIYWFDQEDFTIGYLAYSYAEMDDVGLRFRQAYNPRRVNGILFLDYINYKPKNSTTIDSLESLFNKNELEQLSKVELENIEVN